MATSLEIQMMIKAASCSGGLSRDAIHSIGALAARSARPERCLEDVLEELDPKDQGGLEKLRRIKNATQNSSYLDQIESVSTESPYKVLEKIFDLRF